MSVYENVLNMWRSYKINTGSDIDKYLDNFRILFAFNSGKIENKEITYHDTREIFENGKISNYSGDIKALFEQSNQKLCYEILKDKIAQRQPISIELIKEIHSVLTSGTYDERRYVVNGERPGSFKNHDYVIGVNEVSSSPNYVEEDITELLSELDKHKSSDMLKLGTYLHARFEYIHPFADGNGRVGRTLLNYFLMINDHPPMIIYDDEKKYYYQALEKYDTDENLQPLYEFLKYETEKTWQKTLERNTHPQTLSELKRTAHDQYLAQQGYDSKAIGNNDKYIR